MKFSTKALWKLFGHKPPVTHDGDNFLSLENRKINLQQLGSKSPESYDSFNIHNWTSTISVESYCSELFLTSKTH